MIYICYLIVNLEDCDGHQVLYVVQFYVERGTAVTFFI